MLLDAVERKKAVVVDEPRWLLAPKEAIRNSVVFYLFNAASHLQVNIYRLLYS